MCAELIQLGFQRIAVRTHLRGIYLTSRCDILWLGGEAQVPELQLVVGHPNLVAFDLRHERLLYPEERPRGLCLLGSLRKENGYERWLRSAGVGERGGRCVGPFNVEGKTWRQISRWQRVR